MQYKSKKTTFYLPTVKKYIINLLIVYIALDKNGFVFIKKLGGYLHLIILTILLFN